MRTSRLLTVLPVLLSLLSVPPLTHATLPLETESTRLPKQGAVELQGAVEYQSSSQGRETALPFSIEYGIFSTLSLLVEPVFLTAIRPKSGRGATGLGDLEMTLTWRFLDELEWLPALAIAGEVKVPTASSTLIGTGETDYSPYLIASKRFGQDFDTHLNFGYAILGEPPGVKLDNIFTYAAAVEYHLTPEWDLVGEVVGNTSSSPRSTTPAGAGAGEGPDAGGGSSQAGGGGGESPVAAEATGDEVSGLIGARYYVRPNLIFSLGVVYDNQSAVLLRPGVTYTFSLF